MAQWASTVGRVIVSLLLGIVVVLPPTTADAATFSNSPYYTGSSAPSAINNSAGTSLNGYSAGVTVRCITVQWDQSPQGNLGPPPGFTFTGTTFFVSTSSNFLTDWTSWTRDFSVNGTMRLTSSAGGAPAAGYGKNLVAGNITNGSVANVQYYNVIKTYSDAGCTTLVDSGYNTFSYSSPTTVSASVAPTMSFTVAGRSTACNGATPTAGSSSSASSVDLGHLNSASTVIATQELTASTNAQTGMSVMGRYSGPLNDGKGNTIPSLNETSYATAAAFPAAGTPAFGFLAGWYSPGTWSGFTTTGIDTFLSRYTPGDSNTCIAYRAQAGLATPAGTYSTTVIYTAVARF